MRRHQEPGALREPEDLVRRRHGHVPPDGQHLAGGPHPAVHRRADRLHRLRALLTRVRTDDGSSPSRQFAPGQGFAFADTRVAAKTRILGDASSTFALSATAFTTLPTGMITSNGDCREDGACMYTGERAPTWARTQSPSTALPTCVSPATWAPPTDRIVPSSRARPQRAAVRRGGQYDITPLVPPRRRSWAGQSDRRRRPHARARGPVVRARPGDQAGRWCRLVGEVGNELPHFRGRPWTPSDATTPGRSTMMTTPAPAA